MSLAYYTGSLRAYSRVAYAHSSTRKRNRQRSWMKQHRGIKRSLGAFRQNFKTFLRQLKHSSAKLRVKPMRDRKQASSFLVKEKTSKSSFKACRVKISVCLKPSSGTQKIALTSQLAYQTMFRTISLLHQPQTITVTSIL